MGFITLHWTPNIDGNVTSQRASKRVKTVGGAYSSAGFSPANDMGTAISSTIATVTDNVVYEFILQNICSIGGPTGAAEGTQEQINFACIAPTFVAHETSIDVDTNLNGTDITKVKYVLKKQSDNTVVDTQIITRVGTSAPFTFTGLTSSTGYYVTSELYANIEAMEVVSSTSNYLNAVCGGNVAGYQTSTTAHIAIVRITNSQLTNLITNVTGIAGFSFNTGAPIAVGGSQNGTHSAFTGVIAVTFTGSLAVNPGNLTLTKNGVSIDCITVASAGTYLFASHSFLLTDDIGVALNTGSC